MTTSLASPSFGTIDRLEKSWRVRAVPAVMLRLKRWFPQAKSGAGDSLLVYNSPSNCAELSWILERYPMKIDPDDFFEMVAQAEAQREKEKVIAELRAGTAKETRAAFKLALEARSYQVDAARLCWHSGSLLLADSMGVGKTASAIELLSYEDCLPAIVIAPTHLPKQWQREIKRFAPNLTTHITERMKPYPWDGPPPDVVITNWFKAVGWADRFIQEGRYRTLVLDEAHEARHHDTERYRAISSIRQSVDRAIGLTGTPVYNYGGEMWSVMNVIAPDSLGSRDEFIREWCGGSDKTDSRGNSKPRVSDPRALGMHLRNAGLMLRRTREDVGRELPPLSRVVQMVEADPERIYEVTAELTEFAKTLLSSTSTSLAKMNAGGQLDLKLRQATGVAKAPHVAQFVRILLEEGERVVLFSWHHAVNEIYRTMLAGWNPVFYTGEQTAAQKDEAKRKFVEKETSLLIMSLRSGIGVDGLQGAANIVVFGELDWSPAAIEQCITRIHRDGQKKPTFAYYLLSEAGSDPIMSDVLKLKSGQLDGIRDPNAPDIERIESDPEHVKKLARAFLARTQKTKTVD